MVRDMIARLFLLLALALPPAARAADAPVVVELFTSQGCSSCPPADRLLGRLAERADVLPLAFHVSYWDHIGWTDTFASRETTERQYAYGRTLGHSGVYTPQAVIGGVEDAVGSDASDLEAAIVKARAAAGRVTVSFTGPRLSVGEGAAPPEGATVWLACYDRQHEVTVARGENGGRKLVYHNVVRHLLRLGDWRGAALDLPVDLAAERAAGRDACAALVQAGEVGPVLGAARVSLGGAS